MAGDMSDYNDDHSRADLALCGLLARRLNNDPFKIDEEFRKSCLYRDKWERDDYRARTILKAIGAGQLQVAEEPEGLDDDGPTEYLVDALDQPGYEGWFPKGEVSLIGGSSGTGKTSLMIPRSNLSSNQPPRNTSRAGRFFGPTQERRSLGGTCTCVSLRPSGL